eukprot:CAMPEP_0175074668 /NCGR_PEP_ID=MMETSP0052_2-20121109/21461_1 /TAXON_ID=51329 ORGANISM="Polytomella parva, Strain SAG 63-3" /NCGR_SAMPLE_ID=MMETSP0052_2 /ASSEMBLY_ACC=CAM_ASM_000194 /LENGTH=74 /DNA_ID=CAMNT_0016343045 /DNA_START=652 /DNA_END=876 /DNA_ORIENTATION=+
MALGMSPSHAVAQLDGVEGSNGEEFATGTPSNGSDGVVEDITLVDETAKIVPDFILAILSPGDDVVVDGAPVDF